MKKMKALAVVAIAMLSISSASAQFTIGTDIVSSYVWRGVKQGSNEPNIQPSLTYTSGKFVVGAWGSGNFSGSLKEADLYITYNACSAFSITVTDYNYTFGQSYFNYKKNTDHVFEGTLAYNGVESFPLSLSLNTMVYGADKKSNGDQAFSTYYEFGYPVAKNAKVFLGGSLNESPNYYTKGLSITNLGIKVNRNIEITDKFSLPVYGVLGANPYAKDAFLVVGVTL